MVKVLLVGEGAREHAIAEAIVRSPKGPRLYAAMRTLNPGIAALCEGSGGAYRIGESTSPEFVTSVAEEFSVDYVFVGPEEPLFHGVADGLEEKGFACVGAKRRAAEIEMSKAAMRRLMWKHKVPGRLRFKAFTNVEDAIAYVREYPESVAMKPARQAGGKGVKVIADLQTYLSREKEQVKSEHARAILDKHMAEYSDVEDRILIEERVEGPEYTIQMFTDGRTVKPFPVVQDNKNAYEMDIGPETGGMGSICGPGRTLPFITAEEFSRSVEIVRQSVRAIERESGTRYKGVIAGQMMLTSGWGPTIIEFYSRFGDPEAVNVFPILETDMVEVMEAIARESLHKVKLRFRPRATVVKCIAPRGYPERRDLAKGHPVIVDEAAVRKAGCRVYYGSVERRDGSLLTGGSRVAEVMAEGPSLPAAAERAEGGAQHVRCADGWPVYHRSDIGSQVLLSRRIEQARLIREVYRYRRAKGLVGKTIEWIPKRGKIVMEA